MKIALIGYGKMGKEVERVARLRGHSVCAVIDRVDPGATRKELDSSGSCLKEADVVVDFTVPASVSGNIRKVTAAGKSMVVGTTGWYDGMTEAKQLVGQAGTGFIYSSNFSVGVNIFYQIVEAAARLIDRIPEYDVFGYELHHSQKLDSPSGTAKSIAEILLKNISRKKQVQYEKLDRKINPEEIHFASIRSGSIPGTHIVGFDSEADTIELKHAARNRAGFALGAVMAAEWLRGRKGFFTMNDFISDLFR
ncbi:TPA: 4-hydroxy-tetrahydrodipicolinate reductase [Candidatus Woesearchaeota archaeon]|nr:4-hydroxy-tetrahydrodipicolinate reductase [Candidatus Woesearchaeota archaeon]